MTNLSKLVILLDGGLGQEALKRSGDKATPLWATQVMLDNPQIIQTIHEDYIRAGARVFSLNNYTASRERLTRDATIDLMEPIHNLAKSVARAAVDSAGDTDVKIAGCLGPLMASYKFNLVPSYEHCLESYRELVALQKDGVDLFMVETVSTIHEGKAAAIAAIEAGFQTWISFTLDDEGRRTADVIGFRVLLEQRNQGLRHHPDRRLFCGDLPRWDRARPCALDHAVNIAVANVVPCATGPAHQPRPNATACKYPKIKPCCPPVMQNRQGQPPPARQ